MKISKAYRTFQVFNTIIMIFVVCATLYPFVYLIAQSLSSADAINAGRVSIIPVEFNLDTYIAVLKQKEFYVYYKNTIVYSLTGTVLSVFGTAILAYPLSKKKLRLNKFFIPFVVFTMYFSGGMIPNYILVSNTLGMKNTIWAMIIPGAISTYNCLLMKSFFTSLPDELEEAAMIDGMTIYGVFVKIIIPLSKPILATMCLFYLVGLWNNWWNGFLYLNDKDKWPVALYLRGIISAAVSNNEFDAADASQIAANIKSCSMVLTALPIICVYPFIQKYFVQGMMIGSVKG